MAEKVAKRPGVWGQCLGCGTPLNPIGTAPFRVGGTPGGDKLLLGELAELGEDLVTFEVLACPRCRRVELRVPRNPE